MTARGREPDLTTRFWEIPVPALVVHCCAGQPLLLAAWLNIASAEREDLALGLPPRSWEALAASVGMDLPGFQRVVSALVDAGLMTQEADGRLRVPWTPLYLTSLFRARQQQQQNIAARAAASSTAVHQEPLVFD